MYLRDLLPLLATSGDDGNYAQTAAADLSLLQVIFALMLFRSMFMNEFMQNNLYSLTIVEGNLNSTIVSCMYFDHV